MASQGTDQREPRVTNTDRPSPPMRGVCVYCCMYRKDAGLGHGAVVFLNVFVIGFSIAQGCQDADQCHVPDTCAEHELNVCSWKYSVR